MSRPPISFQTEYGTQAVSNADRPLCTLMAAMSSAESGYTVKHAGSPIGRDDVFEYVKDYNIPPARAKLWLSGLGLARLTPACEGVLDKQLSRYQKETIKQISVAGGAANLGCGLGKTVTAVVAVASAVAAGAAASRCWVACPLNAFIAWRPYIDTLKEWFADVQIISMDSLHKIEGCANVGGCLILDECFPAATLVETEYGPVPIGGLVAEKSTARVRVPGGWASVTGWLKKPRSEDMVEISHELGRMYCTANHPIWTEEDGYVPARLLTSSHHLSYLREDSGEETEDFGAAPVLQSGLLKAPPRSQVAGVISSDEAPESYVDAGGEAAGSNSTRAARVRDSKHAQGGQWPDSSSGGIVPSVVSGMEMGTHSRDVPRVAGGPRRTECVQTRLRTSRAQASRRVGRSQPQWPGTPGPGPAERSRVIGVGVVCTPDKECGPYGRPTGRSGQAGDVYCLEVAGHGCFYAEGLLVHNCHLLGETTARRTKAAHKARAMFDFALCLTGTLLHGGIHKALSVLDLAVPGGAVFPTKWRAGEYFKVLVKKRIGNRTFTELARPTGESKEKFMRYLSRLTVCMTKDSEIVKNDITIPEQILHTIEIGDCTTSLTDLAVDYIQTRMADPTQEGKVPHAMEVAQALCRQGAAEKVDWILNELDDEPVVIFAQYTETLDHVEERIKESGRPYIRIDGSVTGRNREAALGRFQSGEAQIVIGQITAAGISADLQRAFVSVAVDHTWRAADYAQALARTCRRGQANICHHFDLITNRLQKSVVARLRAATDFDSSTSEWQALKLARPFTEAATP